MEEVGLDGLQLQVNHPFLILPEEVWCLVVDELEDPEDLLRVREAHPCFEGVINNKRTTRLFEKVFSSVIQYFDQTDVLICRLVCKRWNSTIFKYFERHPSIWPVSVPPPAINFSVFYLFDGLVLNPDTIDKLHGDTEVRNYFQSHPFLTRHVNIDWYNENVSEASSDQEDNVEEVWEREMNGIQPPVNEPAPELEPPPDQRINDFWSKCMDLLETFQDHVWYLSIAMETDNHLEMHDGIFLAFLQKSLVLLPNLKSVIINGDLGLFWGIIKLSKFLRKYPMPVLPHLECFIMAIPELSAQVESTIYKYYGPQLKRIRMADYLLKEKYTRNQSIQFTEMYVHSTRSESISELQMHEIWCRLRCPQLQKLTLQVCEMKLATIHAILESCPALKVLQIDCRKGVAPCLVGRDRNSPQYVINTSVQVLILKETSIFSYDFFGIIPSLEYLVLEEHRSMETFASVHLNCNLRGFYEPPTDAVVYQSNFWDVLASLKKLIYKDSETAYFKSFTREKREAFMMSN